MITNDDDSVDGGDDSGKRAKGDYDVGYCKPPKHTQFRKGKSGNPRGPKKGSRGIRKDLHKALNARHSITVKGKIMKGTTQELALYTLAARAATGDIRAIKQLTDLILQLFGPEDRNRDRHVLSAQDQELLNRLLERGDPDETEESEPEDPAGPEVEPEEHGTDDGRKEADDEA